jgi:hypothetical protein
MKNDKLVINGKEIDLPLSVVIATNYALGDVQDLSTRRCSYTNRFSVNMTNANKKALGFLHLENSDSSIPYTTQNAQLIKSGIEVLPGAMATIEGGTDDTANIELFSGAKQFFDLLGDKTLEDLVTDATTADFYAGHNGYFEKVYLPTSATNEAQTPLLADDRKLVISYKRILEQIIANNGYTSSGAVFSDSRLAIPYLYPLGDKGAYNSAFRTSKEFDAYGGGPFNITNVYQKVPFTNVVKSSPYYNGTDTNTQLQPYGGYAADWYAQEARFLLTINSGVLSGGASSLQWRVINNGAVFQAGTATLVYPLTLEINMPAYLCGNNKQTYMEVQTNVGSCAAIVSPTSRFYNVVATTVPSSSGHQSFTGSLPVGIKQRDFVKDFAITYGVLFNERNGVLIGKTWKEIIQDKKSARNWTSKRDTKFGTGRTFDFAGKYAQANYFKYPSDGDGTTEFTGMGNFPVPNTNLETKKDYYTSIFSSSLTRKFGNITAGYINCAYIPDGNDATLRILGVRGKYAYEPNLTGPVAAYNVAYFLDDAATSDMSYEKAIVYAYTELKNSLAKAKLLERRYKLTVFDVALLDLFLLVHDAGSYYLVNKVSNYVNSDKSTAVQLLKVT